jgi:cell wall-associated NlpC family hydrolase
MNFNRYIGLPWKKFGRDFDGVDCLGLVVLFYKNELNIELPQFEYADYEDHNSTNKVQNEAGKVFVPTENPKPGDVAQFRILGHPVHVGIVVDDHRFLHSKSMSPSSLAYYNSGYWNDRIEKFYSCNN